MHTLEPGHLVPKISWRPDGFAALKLAPAAKVHSKSQTTHYEQFEFKFEFELA